MSRPFLDGIVGARPNLMKMASIARAIKKGGAFDLRLVHTGQHYDEKMSDVFFSELGLSAPDCNLKVGSGHQGAQTARIIENYEALLLGGPRPKGVIVVGDVTSTMACAIVAAKLGIPIAHVEAGLRSLDRSMPEEINRIITDSISNILFVSDPSGLLHLAREGHSDENIRFVGNTMIDTMLDQLPAAEVSQALEFVGIAPNEYVYLTLHRPSNVDEPAVLRRLLEVFLKINKTIPVVFAIHPRTRDKLNKTNLIDIKNLRVVDPLGYRDNLRMIQCARAVFTDSGGIQEEASVLNVPCVTLRDATERPVTVELGSSELVGSNPDRIFDAWNRIQSGCWKQAVPIPLWDGKAGQRIAAELQNLWCKE